jgi:hypothetical protein
MGQYSGLMRKQRTIEVRSQSWVQAVDVPAAWAQEHRWLLQAAFAAFDQTGEWPLIDNVQRDLAATPDRAVAVAQLVLDIPSELGARHSQQIELTVRALVHVPEAAPLLDLFVRVMRAAVLLYPGGGSEPPRLQGSQIKEQFDLDELTYRKVSSLVCAEGWFFAGGGGDVDGDWWRVIRAEILQIRSIQDVSDYLDALARYRFGPSEIEVERPTRPRGGPLGRSVRWFGKRDPTVLDLLVVGVLSGIVVGVVIWRLTS